MPSVSTRTSLKGRLSPKGLRSSLAQSFRRKDKASSLVLEPIRQLIQLNEWRGRHTGLMAISAVMSSVMEVRITRSAKGRLQTDSLT